jgi:hypothetical protein
MWYFLQTTNNHTTMKNKSDMKKGLCALIALTLGASLAQAADTAAAATGSATAQEAEHHSLATKLANPLAAMVSVPFQHNFDFGGGPKDDGFQWKVNMQPVMPFELNDEWNLITRVIVPYVHQNNVGGTKANESGSNTGFMDTTASAWFSPTAKTKNGWIWGAGAAASLPTGSETALTSNQWGLGPTFVALKQSGHFTYGGLVNHIWSATGNGGKYHERINNTYMQPFFNYLPGNGMTYGVNLESSYNWNAEEWTVPVNVMISKMSKIGKTPVQYQIGGRYYIDKPANGPEFGMRIAVTFLFPTGH